MSGNTKGRKCPKCGLYKPKSEWRLNDKGDYPSYCKACQILYYRDYIKRKNETVEGQVSLILKKMAKKDRLDTFTLAEWKEIGFAICKIFWIKDGTRVTDNLDENMYTHIDKMEPVMTNDSSLIRKRRKYWESYEKWYNELEDMARDILKNGRSENAMGKRA